MEANMNATKYEGMTPYDIYLKEHITAVNQAMKWMIQRHIIEPEEIIGNVRFASIWDHDLSKYSPEEYSAYEDYFYGKEGRDEDDIEVIDKTFDYAWLHHIHSNPHHWQHWVLIEDEGKVKPLEMPKLDVYEMLADWLSFSFIKGDKHEILKWYEKHKDRMQLHKNTRKLVEELLDKIRKEIEWEEKHGHDSNDKPSV